MDFFDRIENHKNEIQAKSQALFRGQEDLDLITKGKVMPIGTVTNGRKKVSNGKWIPVKKDSKRANGNTKGEKVSDTGRTEADYYSATKDKINGSNSVKELRGILVAVNNKSIGWSETKRRALTTLTGLRFEKISGIKVPNITSYDSIKSAMEGSKSLEKSLQDEFAVLGVDLIKGGKKSGYYEDNAKNRKDGTVGQKYSKDKQEDDPKKKGKKEESSSGGGGGGEGEVTGHDIAHLSHMKDLVQSKDYDKAYEIYNTLPPEAQAKVPQDIVNEMVKNHHSEKEDSTWDDAGEKKDSDNKKDGKPKADDSKKDKTKEVSKSSEGKKLFSKIDPKKLDARVDQLIKKSEGLSKEVTADISGLVGEAGGSMYGLEFAVKGEGSLRRKLDKEAYEKEQSGVDFNIEDIIIGDSLRYTGKFDEANYSKGVIDTIKAMNAKGYETWKIKNTWGDDYPPYRGINCNFIKDGMVVELQFHTQSSLETKDPSHVLYEAAREVSATPEEIASLNKQMDEIWNKVPLPKGVAEIATVKNDIKDKIKI